MADTVDWLAHSAPRDASDRRQPYGEHVENVVRISEGHATRMLQFAGVNVNKAAIRDAVSTGAAFHDLGKLDDDIQTALRKGRQQKLPWDHIDAGVAYALAGGGSKDWFAAWLIRAHHAPGLPSKAAERTLAACGPLRGHRDRNFNDPANLAAHRELVERVDRCLKTYCQRHATVRPLPSLEKTSPIHGLPMRLALSCLVDADHADSARHDTGRNLPEPVDPKWEERIAALDHYVHALPARHADRKAQRDALYAACRTAYHEAPIASCQAPVGTGKTFAVTRYLLGQAACHNLRRLFVVAPFTNILSQTAAVLRDALRLPDDADLHAVVAEHHHRADFESLDLRDLATLWRAPVVVTTAVQFFETLAACDPTELRKLHELPGSAIFLDEAHACIPVHHWEQQWLWLKQLAADWSCRAVLASGSMVRFWECPEIVGGSDQLPELAPPALLDAAPMNEHTRVRVLQQRPTEAGRLCLTRSELVEALAEQVTARGPVLCVLNTVQNAAVIARDLAVRLEESDALADGAPLVSLGRRRVLHLSTALTPRDRRRVLREVVRRLDAGRSGWVLVATSIVEAGVDLDFRTGFRERAGVAPFIQASGRINRHGERMDSVLFDFMLEKDDLLTGHPALGDAIRIFPSYWDRITSGDDTSAIVTEALIEEVASAGGALDALRDTIDWETARGKNIRTMLRWSEYHYDYPEVAKAARVISNETRIVVVNQALIRHLEKGERVDHRALLNGSVQLWEQKIASLGLECIDARGKLYLWNDRYDPCFLGIMAGILRSKTRLADGCALA